MYLIIAASSCAASSCAASIAALNYSATLLARAVLSDHTVAM